MRRTKQVARVHGAENRPAASEDAGDVAGRQHARPVELEPAVEAAVDPDDFKAGVARGFDDGADDRIRATRASPPPVRTTIFPDGFRHCRLKVRWARTGADRGAANARTVQSFGI